VRSHQTGWPGEFFFFSFFFPPKCILAQTHYSFWALITLTLVAFPRFRRRRTPAVFWRSCCHRESPAAGFALNICG